MRPAAASTNRIAVVTACDGKVRADRRPVHGFNLRAARKPNCLQDAVPSALNRQSAKFFREPGILGHAR